MIHPPAALRPALALAFAAGLLGLGSCAPPPDSRLAPALAALDGAEAELGAPFATELRARLLPKEGDRTALEARGAFLDLLGAVLAERALDPERFIRVDKVAPPLSADFAPADLSSLDGSGIPLSRAGHQLRRGALEALLSLEEAAKAAGLRLEVGSAYRSFVYQKGVFERAVAADGAAEARRYSAEPGRSQHQLGCALDFSPIDDVFAATPGYAWLKSHAAAYGFSNSYPAGLEAFTGYRAESWHWRWLGLPALRLQKEWFGDIQQRMIVYLSHYR